jgi:hypothetical protein
MRFSLGVGLQIARRRILANPSDRFGCLDAASLSKT